MKINEIKTSWTNNKSGT